MTLSKFLTSAFYSFEILHHHCNWPLVHWLMYVFSVFQTFLNLETDGEILWIQSKSKIFSFQILIPQSILLGYLVVLFCFQLVGLIITIKINRNRTIENTNFKHILKNIVFWVSLINYTINLAISDNFTNAIFRISTIIIYSFLFIINLFLFNFSFNSKRIWALNLLIILDLLRILLVWTNGQRILVLICLFVYLTLCFTLIFFRPIFNMSPYHKWIKRIFALSFSFSIFTIWKIFSVMQNQLPIILQILLFSLLTYLFDLIIQKWVQYKISRLYQIVSPNPSLSQFTLNEVIFIKFLEVNFQDYQDQIKLFLLYHTPKCFDIRKCPCNQIIRGFLRVQNSKLKQGEVNTEQSCKNEVASKNQFKDLYSQFVLISISHVLEQEVSGDYSLVFGNTISYLNKFLVSKQINVNDSNQQDFKKESSQASAVHSYHEHMILNKIRISMLIWTHPNLNQAYTITNSVEYQLKKNKILDYQYLGILNYLKGQIIESKQIDMQVNKQSTNNYCLKYFNSQKINNKLQEIIIKMLQQHQIFWTEVKMKQLDQAKILRTMAKINKYHNHISAIYEDVLLNKEKHSIQLKKLFKIYQNLIELRGQFKYFKHPILNNQSASLKKAISRNHKLYSDESATHFISFSIDQETFGNIKYTNNGTSNIYDLSFTKLDHFVPDTIEKSHYWQIRSFLQTDNNYYQHSTTQPCYMHLSPSIVKPVCLQTHLIAFLHSSQIDLVAFFKFLEDDYSLIPSKQQLNNSSQKIIICVNNNGNILSTSQNYIYNKNRLFISSDLQNILTKQFVNKLQLNVSIAIQLPESDYNIVLIKKIKSQKFIDFKSQIVSFYILQFQRILDIGAFQKTQQDQYFQNSSIPWQSPSEQRVVKNINSQILQIEKEVLSVEKYDQIKQKVNKIWFIVSTPQKHYFKQKWVCFTLLFIFIFVTFLAVSTILMYTRKHEFNNFSDFLEQFVQNEVAMGQAITYLRQININIFTNVTARIPLVPEIIRQVQRLSHIIYDKLMKISPYLTDIWTCVQILPSGDRILRKQRSYAVINNYILNSITNIVQNLKINATALNFTIIEHQIQKPYSEQQQSLVNLINNAVPYVLPNLIALREETLERDFLPIITTISNKPFFYVPMAGLFVCLILMTYYIVVQFKLTNLTNSSFQLFSQFKVKFANTKIKQIDHKLQLLNKKKLQNCTYQKNQQSNLSSQVYSNKHQTNEMGKMLNIQTKIDAKKPSSQLQAYTIKLNNEGNDIVFQNTERQFQNDRQISDSIFRSINKQIINESENKNSIGTEKKLLAESQRQIVFGNNTILPDISEYSKLKLLFLILPIIFYFLHVFFITILFNNLMHATLMLQNKILYRQQFLTNLRTYQYEYGLYEGEYLDGQKLIDGTDRFYRYDKELEYWQKQMQSYLFGNLKNYQEAEKLFIAGNVCEHIDTLSSSQPSFNVNITKDQCLKISNGVLTNGIKQATISFIEEFRYLIQQNNNVKNSTYEQRLAYLNDKRLITNNKLYRFILSSNKYISSEFEKDFDNLISVYELFLLLDTPLMFLFLAGLIFIYIRSQYKKIKKQTQMMKCCFLLIGHNNFLKDPSLVKLKGPSKIKNSYQFLE